MNIYVNDHIISVYRHSLDQKNTHTHNLGTKKKSLKGKVIRIEEKKPKPLKASALIIKFPSYILLTHFLFKYIC